MSLESSTLLTKRRKRIYGTNALCIATLFGVVLFPYFAPSFAEGAEGNAANFATPIPMATITDFPVTSPGSTLTPIPTTGPTASPSSTLTGTSTGPRDLSLYENGGRHRK